MKFTFLTLFPQLISGYFEDSMLKRARDSGKISIEMVDFRAFSSNRYKKVDDTQASGGAGLIISADVLESAIESVRTPQSHIIYLTPAAKRFCHNDARRIARNYEHIVFICGRYGGIDERVVECFVDEVFCIGDYILTGGEIPALVLCDAIARHIPSVLGNAESLCGESFEKNLLESPVFTKITDTTKKVASLRIPLEYLKGNHSKIRTLKYDLSLRKTRYFRPDIYHRHHTKAEKCKTNS